MASTPEQEPTFGIGAVSRLTGIPLDTLRVWERRYDLVTPLRTDDNKRQYSRTDLTRLGLIKQLVDRGHAISAVAALSEEALRERLQVHQDHPPLMLAGGPTLRVLVQGDALPFLVGYWQGEWENLEVVGSHVSYADFEKDAIDLKPEVLVLEMPALQAERVAQLQQLGKRCGARRIVVVYSFGMNALLERLRRDGILALRAPVTAESLAQACRLGASASGVALDLSPAETIIAPRRFDDATLSAVTRLPTTIRCECPQHLADLLFRLNAFETYSADCENRSEDDAALHAHLHRETAKARVVLEEALAYLIHCEEIDLAALQSPA
jgi:MerR family transcriptional regulator, light-induced transcriptional regulator